MLVITGANGTLGQAVVQQLLRRASPDGIAVSVRDPDAAAALAERGVRVRRGDFTDPASLPGAFEGATRVLLVSSNSLQADPVEQHGNAIAAAAAAGARRIVYTSHMGASPDSSFPPMRTHFETERLLRESGVPFTALRNGFYAVTPTFYTGRALQTGSLALPADGPVSWTTQADLAEAAAIVLADERPFDGLTPPLTAGEALTFGDVARLLSELAGRQITRRTLDEDAFRAAYAAQGLPADRADFTLGMFAAARAGDFAAVDPTLERMLGRPPTTLREVLGDSLR